jgi:cytochrome b6-f complex iron-sulfur subunit
VDNSEKKDHRHSNDKISRNQFFKKLGLGAISATAVGSGLFTLDFLSPKVVLERSQVFNAGALENFSPGTVTLNAENRTYIVREKEGGIYAISAVCTHLGCVTRWDENKAEIACPCHGTKFSKTGSVIEGPTSKTLPRFSVSLNEKNEIIVDRSILVDENQILEV